MTEKFCGLCQANGLKRQLILFQLNLEEAILLCENKECVYPLGVTDSANLIVSRKASEVNSFLNLKRRRKKKSKPRETAEPENVFPESLYPESLLQWQNVDSLCWLHSLLSLVANNATLNTCVKQLPPNVDSLLRTLTKSFNKAQELLTINREQAEKDLYDVREKVWSYLQPKMKCERGVNDSPVTALPLLLRENNILAEKMLQVYQWEFNCTSCGYHQINKRKKHLATFPNVTEDFSLQNLSFTRPCYRCGVPQQRSRLAFDRKPDCIFLHFEQGLNFKRFQELDLEGEHGGYVMTQFIQYKRNPDHFICWTRDPGGKRWMELDDLKSPVCQWRSSPPNVLPSEVHIAVWEKVLTVSHPQLTPPEPNKPNTAELIIEDMEVAKNSSTSLLNIDCNTAVSSCKDVSHRLLSPPLRSPAFSPSRGRTSSLVLPQKTRAGQFEPYVPRKKRLISQSCPNSPVCNNSDMNMSPLPSPKLSQSFLTWQDIKEQSKKIAVDDLQSDSGYSSPASVSSCGSIPFGQSNLGAPVSDDVHEPVDKKANTAGQADHLYRCDDLSMSSSVCSSQRKSTDLLHEVDSFDLADKLEQLLPDCLLDNPRSAVKPCTTNLMETKLETFVKLSAEQDQFILDLLAV